MHGHAFPEGGDFFREGAAGFLAQPIGPCSECAAHGVEQLCHFFIQEFSGHSDRRQACAVQNFVGIGVSNAAEDMRVGQGALQSVVFRFQFRGE